MYNNLESDNYKNKPQFLYRYRSMASKDLDRTFTHNELYFSCPDQFNDPFDCRTHFKFKDCNIHDVRRYFEYATNVYPDLSKVKREEMVNSFVDEFKNKDATFPKRIENMMKEELHKYIKTIRMLCLSEVYDDILMWSHYSDGHRGIVLQFDKAILKEQFIGCKEVEYYPNFPTLRDYNERLQDLYIRTKSIRWKYENEWRIIETVEDGEKDEAGKVYTFEKDLLTGIILGCEISNEDADRIHMWRDYGQHQARIYRATKDADSYAIKVNSSISG